MACSMSTTTLLFPNLPPELRNEIYAYLSLPSSNPTPLNQHLPLGLKTFTCKHTTIQLIPTHHASTALLALPKDTFPESLEYASHLLSNAISLQIGVHFHGRVNTLVQADWNKKLSAHLHKLARCFPWLRKVARYDIQILWAPVDGALRSKNGKRLAGQIPLDMAVCLTQLMDQEVKRKRGDVRVGLCLEHRFAVMNALSERKFGLAAFLFGGGEDGGMGFRRLVRGVRKTAHEYQLPRPLPSRPALLAIPSTAMQEDKALIRVDDGVVSWLDWTRGPLVMERTVDTRAERGSVLVQGKGEQAEFPMCHLMAECVMR